MNQCPTFILGDILLIRSRKPVIGGIPNHAEAHLNHVSEIHLLRKMPTLFENLLGFSDTSNPSKVLWYSFFQDKFVAPWQQGTAALRSSHQLYLLPHLQKPEILVLFTAGPKVVAFRIWGSWKRNYSIACTGLVLSCKPCTSVLEAFSWESSFSLLSYAYYFVFFLLESNYCVSKKLSSLLSSPTLLEGNREGFSPSSQKLLQISSSCGTVFGKGIEFSKILLFFFLWYSKIWEGSWLFFWDFFFLVLALLSRLPVEL